MTARTWMLHLPSMVTIWQTVLHCIETDLGQRQVIAKQIGARDASFPKQPYMLYS